MFEAQLHLPRRNYSMMEVRSHHTNAHRRAVSPVPLNLLKLTPERLRPTRPTSIIQTSQLLTIHPNSRPIQQRNPSPLRVLYAPIQRVVVQQTNNKPNVIIYVQQPPKSMPIQSQTIVDIHSVPVIPSNPQPQQVVTRESTPYRPSAAQILHTDSGYSATNNRPSFVEQDVDFSLTELKVTRSIDNSECLNQNQHNKRSKTIVNTRGQEDRIEQTKKSSDPLDECISSLQQRVQSLLTKHKTKNRSRFLMQIVQDGARYRNKQ